MAGKFNLAFLFGVVCVGMTYGQGATSTTMPLSVVCYGKYGNFTSTTRKPMITLMEFCGPEIDIWEEIDATGLQGLRFEVFANCLELGKVERMQDVNILSLTSSDTLKTRIKATLSDIPLDFSAVPTVAAKKNDYCTWRVKLFATYQNEVEIEYASKMMTFVLTLGPETDTNLELEEATTGDPIPSLIDFTDRNLRSTMEQYRHVMVKHMQLPVPADDAKYLAIAFLRYSLMTGTITEANCNELEIGMSEYEDHYPYYSSNDWLVGFKPFEASTEQSSIDLTASLDEKLPEGICGNLDLVYMVDPLFIVFPPKDRCKYFKVYQVYIPCPSGTMEPGPFTCDVVQNAFSLHEAFFTTKGSSMDEVTMMGMPRFNYFEREVHGAAVVWKESHQMVDLYHNAKVRGYPLIVLLWQLFETGLTENDCDPSTATEAYVISALKEFDGVQASTTQFTDVKESSFTTVYEIWAEKSSTDIETEMGKLDENTGTFEIKLPKVIKITILKELKKLKKESSTDSMIEMGENEYQGEEMKIEDIVRPLFWRDDISETELLMMVKNITAKMVHLKHMHSTENSCFGQTYDTIIELIRNYHSGTGNFQSNIDVSSSQYSSLFDGEHVEEFMKLNGLTVLSKWNATRIRMNGCIQGIDHLSQIKCEEKIAIADLDPEVMTKVCKVKKFREFIREKSKAFGLSVIMRDLLLNRAKEAYGKMEPEDVTDPLTVKAGGYSMWDDFIENNMQIFYENSILPTYTQICRRKMAACHCEKCDYYKDMSSADGSIPGTDEMFGSGDQPGQEVKRR